MTNSFDRTLRRTLEELNPAATSAQCLAAETLAAYFEGALRDADRALAEAHLADCNRCQASMAALVRTAPDTAVRAWWRAPRVAWLVPLTAAVAGVLVWVNLQERHMAPAARSSTSAKATRETSPQTQEAAQGAASERDEAVQAERARQGVATFERQADARAQRRDHAAYRDRNSTQGQRAASSADLGALSDSTVPPVDPRAFELRGEPFQSTTAVPPLPDTAADASVAQAAKLPAASDVASRKPSTAAAAPAAADVKSGTGEAAASAVRSAAATAPERPESVPPSPLAETVRVPTAADPEQRARARPPEPVIISSDGLTRWRISGAGIVQRSTDGGATWARQSTGVTSVLTAGASPSPAVCWLVGSKGVVLLSTDGRSWQRLPFPEAVNLISIRATDDKAATVTTADGRTFTTTNGGRTWEF